VPPSFRSMETSPDQDVSMSSLTAKPANLGRRLWTFGGLATVADPLERTLIDGGGR
jgi:hypothetical protein